MRWVPVNRLRLPAAGIDCRSLRPDLLGRRRAAVSPLPLLATADRAQDDPNPEPEHDEVSKHLGGDHEPRRLGLGGDIAEPDGGEHRDSEVQGVGVREPLAELLADSLAKKT